MDAHHSRTAVAGTARKRPHGKRTFVLWLLPVIALAGAVALFPPTARRVVETVVETVVGAAGRLGHEDGPVRADASQCAPETAQVFRPTREQRANLEIRPVATLSFRPESPAEGRIALNEDDNLPVASPYSGRVTRSRPWST